MTPTASHLAKVTRRAHSLCVLGHEDAAAAVLRPVLAVLDPTSAAPEPRLVSAALTYLGCTPVSPETAEVTVAWARYATAASLTLHGLEHPDTAAAAAALIYVLTTTDATPQPSNVRGDELLRAASLLVDAHTALHGHDAPQTLTACSFRATLRHQVGQCEQATTEATAAWLRWSRHRDDGGPILHTLAAMLWACGHHQPATNLCAMHVGSATSRGDAVSRFLQALLVPAHPLADTDHHKVCVHHARTTAPAAGKPDPPCTGRRPLGPITSARPGGRPNRGQVRP